MQKYFTIVLLLVYGISKCQNLVPNGDFEQYFHCPKNGGDLDSAKFWFMPTRGTTDYFNTCSPYPISVPGSAFGYQYPHSLAAYAGIYTLFNTPSSRDYREYLETPLTSPLVAGATYNFEMFINVAVISKYACPDIGVYFSDTIIRDPLLIKYLRYSPQIANKANNIPDTTNWIPVNGSYKAHGGEKYIVIGNFKPDSLVTDTVVCNPSASYPVSYLFIDDVSLTFSHTGISDPDGSSATLYPNPVSDKLTIELNTNQTGEFILYDFAGRAHIQQSFTNTITIQTENLAKGIYLYELKSGDDGIKKGKMIKE